MARRNDSTLNNWFMPLAAGAVITTSMFLTLNLMNAPRAKISSDVQASCTRCYWQGQRCAGNTIVECRNNCFSVVSNCDQLNCKTLKDQAACK